MVQYFVLPVVGFFVGMNIISIGGGGGAIYVGILTAFLNIPPAVAASTSLATTIPTTAAGTFSHWKAGNVNPHLGLIMLAGGVAGSVGGSLCSGLLPQSMYNKLTGIILVFLSVQMIISNIRRKNGNRREPGSPSIGNTDRVKAVLFGLLGGAMSGLIGLSGGGPIVAGLMILGCSALETVGTSVMVLLGIAATGFAAHLGIGNIDWKLVGLLASGTICGAFAGPVFLKHIDKEKLERVLGPLLFLMNAVMGTMLILK